MMTTIWTWMKKKRRMILLNLVVGAYALDILAANLNFFAPNFALLEPTISGLGAHNHFSLPPFSAILTLIYRVLGVCLERPLQTNQQP